MLHKDPNQRIGVKNKTDLKNDPFFKGIDWEKLARKEIPPPPLNTLEEEDSDVVLVSSFLDKFTLLFLGSKANFQ